jgi:hypothetical protein
MATKALTAYYTQANGLLGFKAECKECSKERSRSRRNADPAKARLASRRYYQRHREQEKRKRREYYKANRDKERAAYKVYYQKNASRIAMQRQSQHSKDLFRAGELRRRYGMTISEFTSLSKRQGGRCAICKKTPRRLVVDHCHASQKVRGLLCDECNRGLGYFYDNQQALVAAVEYLNTTARLLCRLG